MESNSFLKPMPNPIVLTILDRELKIKFYPGNDLLEVLGISKQRRQGI